MGYLSKGSINRNFAVSIYLVVFLLLLSVGVSFVITREGAPFGMILVLGLLGLILTAFVLAFPPVGYYGVIICSFFIFTVLRFLNTEAPLVTVIDLMVYLTFASVLLQKARKKESLWKNCDSPIMFMYLIIILYNILEFFNPNGGNKELYFLVMRRFLTLILFLYCSVQLFKDRKDIEQFYRIMLILCFIAAAYACYEEWFGLPGFELAYIQSDPLRERLAALDGGNYRKSSFFSSCTDFGLFMAGAVAIALAFYLKLGTSKAKRRFLLLNVILMALAMTYSGTRTATLMLIVEIALYAVMTITERKTIVFTSIVGLLFAAIIFGPSYGNGTLRRLKSTFDLKSEESLEVRDINRHHIQPYIYTHPIGGGVATTGVMLYSYNVGHPLAGFPTDSGLLSIVLEYGWMGLLIQCLGYFIILREGIAGYYQGKDERERLMLLAATVCLVGYIFAQYAQIAIGQIPGGFLFLGLNGVVIRLRQLQKQPHPELKSA